MESETCGPHAGPSQKQKENVLTLTPVSDRVHNLTALTLGFVAEHSLPVNLVPSLLDYVKVSPTVILFIYVFLYCFYLFIIIIKYVL